MNELHLNPAILIGVVLPLQGKGTIVGLLNKIFAQVSLLSRIGCQNWVFDICLRASFFCQAEGGLNLVTSVAPGPLIRPNIDPILAFSFMLSNIFDV